MTGGSSRFVRPSHNRVDPGEALGVSIRIPIEHRQVVADLLAPHIPSNLIIAQASPITVYPTVGRDTLDGRPIAHRWTNVLGDPPAGISPDAGLGGLACIGAPSNAVNRMWWRHGLGRVPGRLWMWVDPDRRRARTRIVTVGGTLTAIATFDANGEAWDALPQSYHAWGLQGWRLLQGNEWGVRWDGSGSVEFARTDGTSVTFETYIGLDTDLGWDYRLPGWTRPSLTDLEPPTDR